MRATKIPFELGPFEAGLVMGVLTAELNRLDACGDYRERIKEHGLIEAWHVMAKAIEMWQRDPIAQNFETPPKG